MLSADMGVSHYTFAIKWHCVLLFAGGSDNLAVARTRFFAFAA
jgi:hypothetical protein